MVTMQGTHPGDADSGFEPVSEGAGMGEDIAMVNGLGGGLEPGY